MESHTWTFQNRSPVHGSPMNDFQTFPSNLDNFFASHSNTAASCGSSIILVAQSQSERPQNSNSFSWFLYGTEMTCLTNYRVINKKTLRKQISLRASRTSKHHPRDPEHLYEFSIQKLRHLASICEQQQWGHPAACLTLPSRVQFRRTWIQLESEMGAMVADCV